MFFFDFHHHKPKQFGIYNPLLNESSPEHFFSAGIHPKDINENWRLYFEKVKQDSRSKNCIAIGECGLDGLVEVNEKLQHDVFKAHIDWANEIKKPIIIHCVRRFWELIPFRKLSRVPMIVHDFNKKKEIADLLLSNGFHLSFGKALFRNVSLYEIFRNCPEESFFLETDDADFQIEELYQKAAELRNCSVKEIQLQIQKNLENIITL